ncbi:MAG: 4-(cytidine 5'-diphospho)-2-C-methyl-D-erythritol kinase [Actinomycetes bacterium]
MSERPGTSAVDEVTVHAPAKINLQLSVGATRLDGYHDLVSVFQAVSLYDDVVARRADGVSISVFGPDADQVPVDGENLAVRAAVLLARHAGVPADVELELRKQIPVAGGMAGGSADAAGALVACDALWGTGVGRAELLRLAAQLGSDVPFALFGGTAVGLGRGERLSAALARGQYHWVLGVATQGLSTPEVFAEHDRLRTGRVRPEPAVSTLLMAALRSGDAVALGQSLSNDLDQAAAHLRPGIAQVLELGRSGGALGGLVSGSGPTVALLARDADHARTLAESLERAGSCDRVLRAHGPVHGARLLVEPGPLERP